MQIKTAAKLLLGILISLRLVHSTPAEAQVARTVRIILPPEPNPAVSAAARIFAREVEHRCEARVVTQGDAPLWLELAVVPGIGAEGFRIENRPEGGVRISGNDPRGVVYGVGKFLRSSRYDQGGFTPGAWRGVSVPDCPVRGIYFATHFHNFYHIAPIEQVQRYVEELALWGCNCISVWYDTRYFGSYDDPSAALFRARLHAILQTAKDLGLDTALTTCTNEGYTNTPPALRVELKGMRGDMRAFDVCISKPGGQELVLENYSKLFDWARDLGPAYIWLWPYDAGGCGCAQCRPWGANGYLRGGKALAGLIRHKFPQAKVVLSTWFFDQGEFANLEKAFADKPDWVDSILSEPAFGASDQEYLLSHPAPGSLPLVNFPEISMIGWDRWGGYGANPMPHTLQRQWDRTKTRWQGGWPYSEGIYEDLDKVLCLQFYWSKNRLAKDIVREYIAGYFSPEVTAQAETAINILEENIAHTSNGLHLDQRMPQSTVQAFNLLQQADAKLSPQARSSWRWRLLYLRALVDAEVHQQNGSFAGPALKSAFEEIDRIYWADARTDWWMRAPRVLAFDHAGPALPAGYAAAVLASKPAAYYRMNQLKDGRAVDISGHANHATLEPAFAIHSSGEGNAAACTGGRLKLDLKDLGSAYGVELWFCSGISNDLRAVTGYLFSRGAAGAEGGIGDNLGLGGTHSHLGQLFVFNGNKLNNLVAGHTLIQPETWNHVVLTRDGSKFALYLNGKTEATGTLEPGFATGCSELFIGGRNDGFANWLGKLAEVAVHDRALAPAEVAAHFRAAVASSKDPRPQH